ncbi:hypothetical protein [Kribbella jiaozuonensis]|uniref:Uncharacterized protein n=1 Tax=Kribbella jiaozuonensis TaxID=2575441 RepID=A0A4U3LJV3_9ACTN|nr:hypothetical protein [Kribbella jiaozuonensis]TKK74586.1 hypothetical protein FDA38_38180 [Kribbella jiaozuonensis]
MDYEAFDAQLLELADSLRGADEPTVAAEIVRLKALAGQIADERSRRLALIRAEKLPEFISGPKPGTSPQYERASTLLGQALADKRSPLERIAHAERVKTEIAALSRQAPRRESMTILRMNSSLVRLIERLRDGSDGST